MLITGVSIHVRSHFRCQLQVHLGSQGPQATYTSDQLGATLRVPTTPLDLVIS